jgi:ATP-dependent Clp protease ATP-binding subunit ClpA
MESSGATTFCSTIIIMTSNLGSDRMDSIGFTREPAASYEDEVMSFFRPEFFNRMDGAVNFTPLTTETIRTITEKELAEIATREGLTKANLKLKWTARLVDFISKKGFDARYGARPLQRTLERLVVTPLAHFLVEKTEVADRSILVDVDSDNRVTIET